LLNIQYEINKLVNKANSQQLSEVDIARQKALDSLHWVWIGGRERMWKQFSRCKYIKEGDKNTKYFHNIASAGRRSNAIVSLVIQAVQSFDH